MERGLAKAATSDVCGDRLEELGAQARVLTASIATNALELGRIFCEAKPLVKHGGWGRWLAENAPVGERAAQNWMQLWRRFGASPEISGLGTSKLVKMLMLPEGREADFLAEHDPAEMSAKELETAIRAEREKIRAEYEERQERFLAIAVAEREDLEKKLADAEGRVGEIPPEVAEQMDEMETELASLRSERREMQEVYQRDRDKRAGDSAELLRLRAESQTRDKLLENMSRQLAEAKSRAQALEDAAAKGDAEREVSDRLTGERFADLTRIFLGGALPVPQMARDFAVMPEVERRIFEINLDALSDWLRRAVQAVGAVRGEAIEV